VLIIQGYLERSFDLVVAFRVGARGVHFLTDIDPCIFRNSVVLRSYSTFIFPLLAALHFRETLARQMYEIAQLL
jgi:hypothetical protein